MKHKYACLNELRHICRNCRNTVCLLFILWSALFQHFLQWEYGPQQTMWWNSLMQSPVQISFPPSMGRLLLPAQIKWLNTESRRTPSRCRAPSPNRINPASSPSRSTAPRGPIGPNRALICRYDAPLPGQWTVPVLAPQPDRLHYSAGRLLKDRALPWLFILSQNNLCPTRSISKCFYLIPLTLAVHINTTSLRLISLLLISLSMARFGMSFIFNKYITLTFLSFM